MPASATAQPPRQPPLVICWGPEAGLRGIPTNQSCTVGRARAQVSTNHSLAALGGVREPVLAVLGTYLVWEVRLLQERATSASLASASWGMVACWDAYRIIGDVYCFWRNGVNIGNGASPSPFLFQCLNSLVVSWDPLSDILGSKVSSPWKCSGSGFPIGPYSVLYFFHQRTLHTVQEFTVLLSDWSGRQLLSLCPPPPSSSHHGH